MKFFFNSKEKIDPNKIPNRPNNGGFGFLASVLYAEEQQGQCELFKRIYDAADIIADKRYDICDGQMRFHDQELEYIVNGSGDDIGCLLGTVRKRIKEIQDEQEERIQNNQPDYNRADSFGEVAHREVSNRKTRLILLEALHIITESMTNNDINNNGDMDGKAENSTINLKILYFLTSANICLRISQVYHDTSDFERANEWGDKAGELIWHGKCLADQVMDDNKGKWDSDLKLYAYALRLNQATYYLNYARKNRRSNYSSALDELDSLIDRQYTEDRNYIYQEKKDVRRGFALIYIEAMLIRFSIRRIQRKENERGVLKEIIEFEQKFSNTYEENDSSDFDISVILSALEEYDRKRSKLVLTLYIARFYRDMHSRDDYVEAIREGQKAIHLSQQLDDKGDQKNIDAVIIISSTLRKLIILETYEKAIKAFNGVFQLKESYGEDANDSEEKNKSDEKLSFEQLFEELDAFSQAGYFDAISEQIKWCYLVYTLRDNNQKTIPSVAKYPDYRIIRKYFEPQSANKDLRLRFLEGIYYLKVGDFKKAEQIFLDLLDGSYRDVTKYIRPGTIGLKSRYLIARVYLSKGDYVKARRYLEEVRNTFRQLKDSRQLDEDWHDYRTIVDLVYCYIRQGNYEDAYQLFIAIGLDKTGFYTNEKDDIEKKNDKFLSKLSTKRRISGLNNLIRCCIFSFKKINGDSEEMIRKLTVAKNVIAYLREKQNNTDDIQYDADFETELLNGYYELLNPEGKEELDRTKKALEFFKKACKYDEGFTPTYMNKTSDKSRQRHSVEYLSAYLITTIKLYKLTENKDIHKEDHQKYEKELRRFLGGIPKRVEISMNAAIALAEWLLEYAKKTSDDTEKGVLFRSFCYVTIYDERGAGVFNQLKDNREFRLLKSSYRGEIIALLLAMYKPIKALKEECIFDLDDLNCLKKSVDSDKMDLVHYTGMDTLKVLLPKKKNDASNIERRNASEPRFRINNCGYMNDVFEGRVLLRCLREIALTPEGIRTDQTSCSNVNNDQNQEEVYDNMLFKFFPYLERTEMDRKPMASNVYIGSLSVKADSFPIWDCYANKEKGCNISFGEGYFDINGAQYNTHQIREYMFSTHTDKSYPLYIVQYIKSETFFKEELKKYLNSVAKIDEGSLGQWDISICGTRTQHCGTNVIEYKDLCRLLHHIYLRWKKLSDRLDEIETELQSNGKGVSSDEEDNGIVQIAGRIHLARQFTADRLNEIRFLFKDADYEFESEVRIVHTEAEADNTSNANIDYERDIPKPYTDIDRDLEGLTIRLGSRIPDSDVDMIVTWLKQTGRVNTVKLSTRNRYILRTTK